MRKLASFLLVAAAAAFGALASEPTALDRYVQAPDPNYKFELVRTLPGKGYTAYVLEMTSQSWRSAAEVDRPLWKHWLTIVKPDKVQSATGLLLIGGGSNDGKPPEKIAGTLPDLALATNTVTAELRMVPNQTLTFSDDHVVRTEDSLVAYTWDKFVHGGDETWPLRLPMTKSAVRAMDTITSFCAKLEGGVKVDKFVVSGGSKRGWTTWTTAAVDRRVIAIAPIVIDVLNMEKTMQHHWRAYGFWAPAVANYSETKLFDWLGTPQNAALMKIEDPYSYRDRLTMPKLIMNSTGDQFFLPDSSQFYFADLKGENNLRYVPNADHSLRNSDAGSTLGAFYESIVRGTPRPRFTWTIGNGTIRVKSLDKPSEVKVWQATNPAARDFRLQTIGPVYTSAPLEAESEGVYVARISAPPKGWTAWFMELTFPTGGKYPLKLTTEVKVLPETYPYPAYTPAKVN